MFGYLLAYFGYLWIQEKDDEEEEEEETTDEIEISEGLDVSNSNTCADIINNLRKVNKKLILIVIILLTIILLLVLLKRLIKTLNKMSRRNDMVLSKSTI